ncbi:hypothetical protein PoB_002858700 [Plakobranchus ocellatus]|uniref:Uncharacterized protein n=1 Tax=Plakobranchus ocellatus TaxID=259542 RepID=A0AAV4A5F6_9GAST|nr:hypothetical protein PoB_002858700 [Plakobranchus ocellatus]
MHTALKHTTHLASSKKHHIPEDWSTQALPEEYLTTDFDDFGSWHCYGLYNFVPLSYGCYPQMGRGKFESSRPWRWRFHAAPQGFHE